MPKYIATRDTWLSHECRLVKADTEFETTFPEGMKLSDNLKQVEPEGKKKPAAKQEAGDLV